MQSENKILDDLAKMLNGVAGTVAGMGREAEANFKERARDWAGGLDLVSREEFDAIKQLASNARAEVEVLNKRVLALEAALNIKTKPTAIAAKVTTKKASAAAKSSKK